MRVHGHSRSIRWLGQSPDDFLAFDNLYCAISTCYNYPARCLLDTCEKREALSSKLERPKGGDDGAGQHEANTRKGLEAVWTHIGPYPKKVNFQARA